MPLPVEEGRYLAAPVEWTVEEAETGHRLLQFIAQYDLLEWYDGSAWVDVRGENYSIRGYHYLFKSDGNPNTSTIDNLKSALGWDGASVRSLADGNWAGVEVQLTLKEEEYNGKRRMKVKWIANRDSDGGGGIERADPQQVQSLETKYGSKLRALGGPAKPASGRPAPTAKPTAPANATEEARKEAWAQFLVKWNEFVGENPGEAANKNERWKAAVTEHFGTVDQKSVGAAQWKEFAAVLAKDWSPAAGFIPF